MTDNVPLPAKVKMHASGLISVLMPVFDAAVYIDRAIESILSQTYENLELIIVDDGSTDSTARVCEYYMNCDSRILLYRKVNRGIVSSLNFALSKASGEFIARMDADDISEPERLDVQLAFMHANPQLSLVGSLAILIDENDAILGLANKPVSPRLVNQLIAYQSPIIHPSLFATRASMLSLGGYRNLITEDLDLFIRANQSGHIIGNCSQYLLRYRVNKSGLSERKSAENLICTNALLSAARGSTAQSYLDSTSKLECEDVQASAYLQFLLLVRAYILRNLRGSGLVSQFIYYLCIGAVSILHVELILLMYRAILSRFLFAIHRRKPLV